MAGRAFTLIVSFQILLRPLVRSLFPRAQNLSSPRSPFFFLNLVYSRPLPCAPLSLHQYSEPVCSVPDTPLRASQPHRTLLVAPGERGPQWSCVLQLLLRQASRFLPTRFLAVSELSERQMLLGGDSILRDSYLRNLPKVGEE